MKVLTPVDSVPSKNAGRDDGKYAEVYKRLDKLVKGQWLPVQFETTREAYNFRLTVETHRTRLMEGRQRKCVVYVRNKEKR